MINPLVRPTADTVPYLQAQLIYLFNAVSTEFAGNDFARQITPSNAEEEEHMKFDECTLSGKEPREDARVVFAERRTQPAAPFDATNLKAQVEFSSII